ncbi:MAG: TRAM domain-containing protein [Puniceicoccales bacterium]|nr:TRAM domain-containing protein [Puniceicoccales bacterium]
MCGRTKCGDKVIFDGESALIGQFVNVKITDYAISVLYGKLVE